MRRTDILIEEAGSDVVVSALSFSGLGIVRFGPQYRPYQTLFSGDRRVKSPGTYLLPGLPLLNRIAVQERQTYRLVIYGEVRRISSV